MTGGAAGPVQPPVTSTDPTMPAPTQAPKGQAPKGQAPKDQPPKDQAPKLQARSSLPPKILGAWLELDLSASARAGELSRAFCQEALVERLSYLLELNQSLILTGEAGVGKTALIHELVARAEAGRGPRSLAGKRVLQLSFKRCLSTLKGPKQLGGAFRKLLRALAKVEGVVPFFSDLDAVYRYDLETQLEAFADTHPERILGEGSPGTIRALLDYSPGLNRKFTPLPLEEPSVERTGAILQAWAEARTPTGEGPGQRFSQGACEEALYLSQRFVSRLRQPRKALELLAHTAQACAPGARVTSGDVIERFCQNHRAPRWLLDPSASLDLSEVEARFAARLVGQREAVQAVVNTIGHMKAGLSDPKRPFGVFLFVGSTGVGKTYLAQLLAQELFGDPDHLVRINMGDFSRPDSADVLFGDPDDRRVAASRGLLSKRLLGHPLAVVLLDEFEKCHPDVHDRFMQLFDEGRFINGAGETVSCRSNILIATSNAGAARTPDLGFRSAADRAFERAAAERGLREALRLELLNRFDQVVHFEPLARASVAEIVLRELQAIAERPGLKQRGLSLALGEAVLEWLVERGFDPEFGVRYLKRAIQREATTPLADAMVRGGAPWGSTLRLRVTPEGLRAEVEAPTAAAPAPLESTAALLARVS